MSLVASHAVLVGFAIFCRIGGCLMLMPGFSSRRVPVRVRLLLSVAVTVTLSPLLFPVIEPIVYDDRAASVLSLVASEMLIGMLFGFTGRLFFAGLEMAGTAIASLIGFGGLPGAPVEGDEPVPPLSALITMSATAMFFITEMHLLVLRGLVESYRSFPPGIWFRPQQALMIVTARLAETLFLTGRITAPFIIYAVVINLAIGLTNKLSPQVPVFFVSLPFVVAGGLLLFYFVSDEIMLVFIAGFRNWIING